MKPEGSSLVNTEIFNELVQGGHTDRESGKYIWLPQIPEWQNGNTYFEDFDWLKLDNIFIFGRLGGNAFYAWSKETNEVFYCDEVGAGTAVFYAPDLSAALFRMVMEFAAGLYDPLCSDEEKEEMDEDEADEYISESEAVGMLKCYLLVFGKYWKSEWREIIENMINKGIACGDAFIYPDAAYGFFNDYFPQNRMNTVLDLNK